MFLCANVVCVFFGNNFDNFMFVNNYHAIRNEVTIISRDIIVMTLTNNNERTNKSKGEQRNACPKSVRNSIYIIIYICSGLFCGYFFLLRYSISQEILPLMMVLNE